MAPKPTKTKSRKIIGEDDGGTVGTHAEVVPSGKTETQETAAEPETRLSPELEEMLAEYEALRDEMGDENLERVFDEWERRRYNPRDFKTPVPADALEASIGYGSLFRQMHAEFDYKIAYYASVEGGTLSTKEARAKAFHECTNREDALQHFKMLVRSHVGSLSFSDLLGLQQFAPRVAERLWEKIKREGQQEFQSGYLGANISFPPDYQSNLWNIGRYQGMRDSFIDDWKPKGSVELSLIDMLTQAYFQWQFWLEQTVIRSKSTPNVDHPHYDEWKTIQLRTKDTHGISGYWTKPTLDEAAALEQAFKFADRWHRVYMRTLRQLRDLRRYTPLLINNVEQVNIAADGGQQVNVQNKVKKK